MTSESLALCNFLKQRGYTAFFIGDRCGIEIYNHRLKNKLPLNEVVIMSNVPKDEVSTLFSNHVKLNDPNDSIMVKFAGKTLQIILYDNTVIDCIRKLDFTLDAIMKNDVDYVNYAYTINGQECTAIDDIRNKIIRAMDCNRDYIVQNPTRILRAFELMATFGFNIECDTLELIIKHPTLLTRINRNDFKIVMNKIIMQNYSYKTFNLMAMLGLFNFNIGKINVSIFNDFKYENLIPISGVSSMELGPLERWALLLYSFDDCINRMNYLFHTMKFFTFEEFKQLRWLVNNINMVDDFTLNNKIELNKRLHKSATGFKLMELRNLVIKLCNLYHYYFNRKDKADALKFALCSRPYFVEQLENLNPTIMELTGIDDSNLELRCRRKLLNILIESKLYPQGECYDLIVGKVITRQLKLFLKK